MISNHALHRQRRQIAALRAATLSTQHAWLDGLKAVNPEAYHYWLLAIGTLK